MKKRSTKSISLVLIASLLALTSCESEEEKNVSQKAYMRADGSAPYSEVNTQQSSSSGNGHTMGMIHGALLYHMFSNMGGGNGFASRSISSASNVGTNTSKSNAYSRSTYATSGKSAISSSKSSSSRGGFGSSSRSSSGS